MSNTGRFCVLFNRKGRGTKAKWFLDEFTKFVEKHVTLHNLSFYPIDVYGEEDIKVVTGDCDCLTPKTMDEFFYGKDQEGITCFVIHADYGDNWEQVL